jgi:5-methylcytosine-specific restriction endonuclease McrA
MLNLSPKFATRRDSLWESQKRRASSRKSKTGRITRKGYVLPFDKKQFTAWLVDIFADGTRPIRCRYCLQPIDVYNCQLDHAVPLQRSGRPDLDNINPICESCNKSKHVMLPEEFELFLIKMREMADHFHNGIAVKSIMHRLESYSNLKAAANQARAKKNAGPPVPAGMHDDDEDF